MRNFFGYIRVSTIKQGDHGVSLQEQREAIAFYAQKNNLVIVKWFEEKETAAKRGRPIFNQMMRLLRQNKAEGVIIHKIDRSARNLKDWADLGELIDSGIKVHFTNENLDLNSRGGRLSADIQAVVAADYIRNLREETRKGFYGRLKQGLYPLPAPLGYLNMGKEKVKELDPVRAPLIKKAFELYSTGRYSLMSLVEELNSLGLRNRNNQKVSKNGLSVILNNPFYIGLIRIKTSKEIFCGIHQPMTSKVLFDRVQQILKGKLIIHSLRHDLDFRRMITCKYCGHSLYGEIQKGHVYYRCHTKTCPTTCFKEAEIEQIIINKIAGIQFDKQEILFLKNKIEKLRDTWAVRQEEQSSTLKLSLSGIQDRIERLTDAYIDRLIEKDIFEKRKESLYMELRTIEDKLVEMKGSRNSMPDKLAKFLELATNVYSSYKAALPCEKREILEKVTSNRIADHKNVLIELKLPFQEVANRHIYSNGTPHRDRPRTTRANLPDDLSSKCYPHASYEELDKLFYKLVEYLIDKPYNGV
jgi:site-specific DNA recombinase